MMEKKRVVEFLENQEEQIDDVGKHPILDTYEMNRLRNKFELRKIKKNEMKFVLEWLSECNNQIFLGEEKFQTNNLIIEMLEYLLKDGAKRKNVEKITDTLIELRAFYK